MKETAPEFCTANKPFLYFPKPYFDDSYISSMVKSSPGWAMMRKLDPIYVMFVALLTLCFFPYLFDIGIVPKNSTLENSLNSEYTKIVFVISLSASFPLFVDLCLDLVGKSSDNRFFLFDRFAILFSATFVPVIYFVIPKEYPCYAQLFMCLFVAQKISIAVPFCRVIRSSSTGIFTAQFSSSIYLLFCVIQIMIQYWGLNGPEAQILYIATWIAIGLSYLYFLGTFHKYFMSLLFAQSIRDEEYVPFTFSTLMGLFALFLGLINTVGGGARYEDFTSLLILMNNLMLLLTAVVATIMPGRVARFELADRERMIELKQNFVRYISHEIRTPINVSLVGLEVLELCLKEAQFAEPEAFTLMAQIKESVSTATDILNDLLTYEKLTSNLMVLEKTQEHPIQFVEKSMAMFQMQAQGKDIRLSIQYPDSDDIPLLSNAVINIDKFKMAQVIRNFASNAIKFTPANGSVKVLLSTFIPTDSNKVDSQTTYQRFSKSSSRISALDSESKSAVWMRLEMQDSGAGIAPENLSKVFNQIIQFDANKLQEGKGTGLGLFISKGIVSLHHGVVRVKSAGLGLGCSFILELPLFGLPEDGSCTIGSASPSRRSTLFDPIELGDSSLRRSPELDHVQTFEEDRTFSDRAPVPAPIQTFALNRPPGDKPTTHEKYSEEDIEAALSDSGLLVDGGLVGSSARRLSSSAELLSRLDPFVHQRLLQPAVDGTSAKGAALAQVEVVKDEPLRGLSVLLVDDSAVSVKLVTVMLKKFGAKCTQAPHGQAALDLVKRSMLGEGEMADIVLMDNLMPVMNGPAACKLMRESGFKNLIVGLTGHTLQEDVDKFLLHGADRVFKKPIDFKEFIQFVTSRRNV